MPSNIVKLCRCMICLFHWPKIWINWQSRVTWDKGLVCKSPHNEILTYGVKLPKDSCTVSYCHFTSLLDYSNMPFCPVLTPVQGLWMKEFLFADLPPLSPF